MSRRAHGVRQFLAVAGLLLVVLWAVSHLRCHLLPAGDVSSEELAYRGALLRCVDKATTLAESKACRREVDATLGVNQDGGR